MLPSNYTYRLFNNTYLSICIYLPTTYLCTIYLPNDLAIYYIPTYIPSYPLAT
jgi:hypothetical protein